MHWLITGGSGFIGTNLALMLDREGEKVTCIDRIKPQIYKVPHITSDVRMFSDSYYSALGQVDVVVHLAAISGVPQCRSMMMQSFNDNVAGLASMLAFAKLNDVKRVIFSSSGAVLAGHKPPLVPELRPEVINWYGAQKAACEMLMMGAAADFHLDTTVLRLSNVYGPHSLLKTSAVHKFIRAARDGKSLIIHGDGKQTRDFIYVEDVCNAFMAAGLAPVRAGAFSVFHVGSGVETSVDAVADMVTSWFQRATLVPMPDEDPGTMRSCMDITATKEALGWSPQTLLGDGIGKTARWYTEEKLSKS